MGEQNSAWWSWLQYDIEPCNAAPHLAHVSSCCTLAVPASLKGCAFIEVPSNKWMLGRRVRFPEVLASLAFGSQVPDEECVVYPAERVRRPVPEIKAVAKAVEMIRVRRVKCLSSFAPSYIRCCVSTGRLLGCQQAGVLARSSGSC